MKTGPTTLYRLRAATGDLLYVGISGSWPNRMLEHQAEKEWWAEVASISVETLSDRESAFQAEAEAIIVEKPRYNRTSGNHAVSPGEPPAAGWPIRRGHVVALGMRNGRAPVGLVESASEGFITITLHDWVLGMFIGQTIAVRLTEVEELVWADWHRTTEREQGFDVAFGTRWTFDMDPLGSFQTRWTVAHSAEEIA